ncbi:kinase-like domain-containing protein [Sporodiniella umbellata]|nr:kinase-like domain-containing protein [Sporodiniella umbellata]
MSIPSSPSSRMFRNSPTSPSYSELQYKRSLLDEVNTWSTHRVSEWLYGQSLGCYSSAFIEQHISGSVLLDLGYHSLKAMEIKTVGERVRIITAIKSLRQECYLAASLAARTPTKISTPPPDYRYEDQFQNTKTSKSTEISSGSKSLLSRSNSFSRFLGRSESRKLHKSASNSSNHAQLSPSSEIHLPPSPKTIQKRNSLEGGIMSVEKIKQTCVKVFGEDGQTRIVNVINTNDSKIIMGKVLHKFGIDESNANHFCIFVGSSTNGEARALSDQELVDICRSTDRPEKERLILRKRHQYPTHEQFKMKGTVNQRPALASSESLKSILSDTSANPLNNTAKSRRQLFGERPTSEAITFNLKSFFPNHNRELLETAGIKAQRLSMSRHNSSLGKSETRINRNSVLPELASVLGVELDNLIEEIPTEGEIECEEDPKEDPEQDQENTENTQNIPKGDLLTECQDRSSSLSHAKEIKLVKVEKKREEEAPSVLKEQSNKQAKHSSRSWMKGSLIGRGTFGDVYLGLNPLSGELMAVKQVELPVENSATEERKKSMVVALQREIDLLKELEHENIVQYLGSKIDDSYFSIFLEYVPGGSVSGILASYGTFQDPLVKSFVRQILKGLNYLHNKDIVHRDIKGANVLVDNKGCVKITDFGISKKVEEDIIMQNQSSSASHRPSLQGSIYWMAPEVVKQTLYTRKADIWSLGCMVIEMFTGDHPFPEFSQMQAIFQIGSYTAPNIPPNLSEDAQSFLKCTFKINHEERSSAEELLEHRFLTELPVE